MLNFFKYGEAAPTAQPLYFQFNDDQDIIMVSSDKDCIYINLETGQEEDMDDILDIWRI